MEALEKIIGAMPDKKVLETGELKAVIARWLGLFLGLPPAKCLSDRSLSLFEHAHPVADRGNQRPQLWYA